MEAHGPHVTSPSAQLNLSCQDSDRCAGISCQCCKIDSTDSIAPEPLRYPEIGSRRDHFFVFIRRKSDSFPLHRLALQLVTTSLRLTRLSSRAGHLRHFLPESSSGPPLPLPGSLPFPLPLPLPPARSRALALAHSLSSLSRSRALVARSLSQVEYRTVLQL
jgi:hypothetical protein